VSHENEASRVYDWGAGRSVEGYYEFLQNRDRERSIRFQIDESARYIVGNANRLADRHIEIIGTAIETGVTTLSLGLDDVRDEVSRIMPALSNVENAIVESGDRVTAAVYWGFSRAIGLLGRVADGIDELLATLRRPAFTAAYEQFQIAREAFEKGWMPEALVAVGRAIDGAAGYPGYPTEYRFHILRGKITLGGFGASDSTVISALAAEEAFLLGGRYAAGTDAPTDAADAFIWAGRAAFVRGRINAALEHTIKGLGFEPLHAQGQYQAARLCALQGDRDQAIKHLSTAVTLNPDLSYAAIAIDQFGDRAMVQASLEEARDRLAVISEDLFRCFEQATTEIRALHRGESWPIEETIPTLLGHLANLEATARVEAESREILGLGRAIGLLREASRLMEDAPRLYHESSEKNAISNVERVRATVAKAQLSLKSALENGFRVPSPNPNDVSLYIAGAAFLVFMILVFGYGLWIEPNSSEADHQNAEAFVKIVGGGSAVGLVLAFIYKSRLVSEGNRLRDEFREDVENRQLDCRAWQIVLNERIAELHALHGVPLGSVDAWKGAWDRRNKIALYGQKESSQV
jgi:tetratricopeptide (TPR) repeat protein